MKLLLTMDWEGLSLNSANLQRLRDFKTRWDTPLVHYMNPAYFTHKSLKETAKTTPFRSLINDHDEWGLHLHAAKHFIQAAGVAPRSSPCFSIHGESYRGEWAGQEVMLHSFLPEELQKLVYFSKEVFKQQGFPEPKSFRAGGWMMDPEQLSSLKEVGIQFDSSATPAESLAGSCWEGDQLHRYIKVIWGQIDNTSQPFEALDGFYEVPNNLGAIDYWQDPLQLAQDIIFKTHQETQAWVITAHQETAEAYLNRLDLFLETLINSGMDLEFHTNKSLLESLNFLH